MRLFSESATTRNVLRSSGVSGERSGTRDILPESHRMATGTAGLEAGGSLPVPTARDTFAPASMETYTLRPRSDARPERLYRSDSEDVVNLLRSRAGLDRKGRRFPRKSAIVEIFSMAVNRSTTVPALLEDGYAHLYEHLDDLVRLEEEYRRYKREKDLVDYDDLLVLLRDLLRDQQDVAAQLSRTYRYVMVDEYQDTNRLQAEIVRGLAVAHDNVMAVGDDSQ